MWHSFILLAFVSFQISSSDFFVEAFLSSPTSLPFCFFFFYCRRAATAAARGEFLALHATYCVCI